jgi:hypothetical protein
VALSPRAEGKLRFPSLDFARWLYKIPLDQRSSDAIVIEVIKMNETK